MKHSAGCPVFSFQVMGWLERNTWFSGSMLFFIGAFVALAGTRYFSQVMSIFAGMAAFSFICVFAAMMSWINSTLGVMLTLTFAIFSAAVMGTLMGKYKNCSILFLGLSGGWFVGSFTYTLIYAFSGFNSFWALFIMTMATTVIGVAFAFLFRDNFALYATCVIGSYMFMRSWTKWCGGYPSEVDTYAALLNGEEIELTWAFWLYCVIFIGSTIYSYKF
jgi:hypothetical protein